MIKRYLFGLIFDFVLDDIEEFVFVIFYRIIENLILVYIWNLISEEGMDWCLLK